MKKYTSFLAVFILALILLGFNLNTASAANCAFGELFNTATGQLCATSAIVECPTGDLFHSGTGERCNAWKNNSSTSVTAQFALGARGESVRAFQQVLKDSGFLVSGKVDGVYGPITSEAATRYYLKYPYPCYPSPCIYPPAPKPCYTINNNLERPEYYCPPTTSPVISGVNGPQSLNINQQGTWTVTAYDSSPLWRNLAYSVVWGDEFNIYAQRSAEMSTLNQSATFTHSYSQAGTYTPTFTVTNGDGQSAQTSLSVNVNSTCSSSGFDTTTGFRCGCDGTSGYNMITGEYCGVSTLTSSFTSNVVDNAYIKATMSNARAQAELYYDDNGQGGYAGVCTKTNGVLPTLTKAAQKLSLSNNVATSLSARFVYSGSGASNSAVCHDSADAWAAIVSLKDSSTSSGWCVDSLGTSKEATSLAAYATACP